MRAGPLCDSVSVDMCGLYAARRAMRACLQTKSEVKQKNIYYICMCHKKSLIANVIVWRLRNTNVILLNKKNVYMHILMRDEVRSRDTFSTCLYTRIPRLCSYKSSIQNDMEHETNK